VTPAQAGIAMIGVATSSPAHHATAATPPAAHCADTMTNDRHRPQQTGGPIDRTVMLA
jgi:hypothetical protein